MYDKVREALGAILRGYSVTLDEAEAIRAHIEGLEADKANSDRQDMAVWRYLQSVSPWSPSNDMEWCDEIITGIDFLRERVEQAEALLREAMPFVDTNPDLARPGGDELRAKIAAAMQESRDG